MVHGVTKNADLAPGLIRREIRPARYIIKDFLILGGGFITFGLGMMSIFISFTEYAFLSDSLIFAGIVVLIISGKLKRKYPLRTPVGFGEIDKETGKPDGDGIFLIGNDIITGESAYINNDDARTHLLCFGSTGSGKTRFLLSMFYQALILQSGVMYVDGKGDTTVFGLVFSMVRRLGREDDLMVINYLTGSKSGNSESDGTRLSNTTNPFAYGPAETLRSLVVSLMRDSGGDDMWKGRASALLAATLQTLVYLRDNQGLNISVGVLREYLPLDRTLELTQRTDIPEHSIGLLKKYLLDLPGYNEADALAGDISPKCYEQHGFLTMQLTEVLSELSSTYGHIFNTPMGEIDYKDLVYNRRILFVMLPALEKDPDALAGLGKLVVAGVRSALAPALGEKVEGSHEEVMDAKPTNSNVPFLLILDEYGYYSVKGFSVVAAQARSLGMSVIFAGQDFPSFKKASEDEAKSVVANTNVKLFMKNEDSGETLQLAVDRGGEAEIAVSSGYDAGKTLGGGYTDNRQGRIERIKRVNSRDLSSQKPGQGHLMFGDVLLRLNLYYTVPNPSPEYRINRMIMVRGPSKSNVKRILDTRDNIGRMFKPDTAKVKPTQPLDLGLKALFNGFEVGVSRKQGYDMSAMLSFGLMEHQERLLDDAFVRSLKGDGPDEQAPSVKAPVELPGVNLDDFDNFDDDDDFGAPSQQSIPAPVPAKQSAISESEPFEDDQDDFGSIVETLPFLMHGNEVQGTSIRGESDSIFASLSNLIGEALIADDGAMLSPAEREAAGPYNQLYELEIKSGKSKEAAEKEARKGLAMLDETISYPMNPQPAKLPVSTIGFKIEEMTRRIMDCKGEDESEE